MELRTWSDAARRQYEIIVSSINQVLEDQANPNPAVKYNGILYVNVAEKLLEEGYILISAETRSNLEWNSSQDAILGEVYIAPGATQVECYEEKDVAELDPFADMTGYFDAELADREYADYPKEEQNAWTNFVEIFKFISQVFRNLKYDIENYAEIPWQKKILLFIPFAVFGNYSKIFNNDDVDDGDSKHEELVPKETVNNEFETKTSKRKKEKRKKKKHQSWGEKTRAYFIQHELERENRKKHRKGKEADAESA